MALRSALGLVPRRKGKAVLIWGRSPASLARAEPLLEELSRRHPRLNLLRLCPAASLPRSRRGPGSGAELFGAPAAVGPGSAWCLARSRARLLLLVDPPDAAALRLRRLAAARGVAVAEFGRPGSELEALEARIAGPLAAAAETPAPRPRLAGLLASPALAPLLRLKYERIDTLSDLAAALGRPETIACLGNGPSCEDPRLRELHWDALFRVNHGWLERGFLVEPQMVFTGRRASLAAVGGRALFGFQTREEELRLLARCLWLPHRIRYVTVERLGIMDFAGFGGFVPTNGAVMLATAVALQPRRLVVAGMDLFSHPAGSYPGDASTPNAYTVLHDRGTELAFLLSQLERFRGELVLVGDVLAGHWRAHRAAAPGHAATSA